MGKILEIISRVLPGAAVATGLAGMLALLGFVTEYGEQSICYTYKQLAVPGFIIWAAIEYRKALKARSNPYG